MSSPYILSINPKPLKPKPPKPKLVWPSYRQLLNLDKQKTEKIESDDQNEDYLQKLLKKEKQQKQKQEEYNRLHQAELKQQRKQEQRKRRALRRLEKKRMIEDGLVDPEDLSKDQESEDNSVEEHQDVLKPTQPSPAPVQQKQQSLKSLPSVERAKTTSHGRRCLVPKPVNFMQQPVAITNAIYRTQKRALPTEYNTYLKQLRSTQPINNIPRQHSAQRIPSSRHPNPQRLSQLSKPKSALSSSRKLPQVFEFDRDAFLSTHNLQKTNKDKFDFNFVSHSSQSRRKPSPKHKQHHHHQLHNHHAQQQFSLTQLFLRKMFVKGGDEQMFLKQLARKRKLP